MLGKLYYIMKTLASLKLATMHCMAFIKGL